MRKIVKHRTLKFVDYLLIAALLLQDAGTFGVLPLNIAQIIILLLLGCLIMKNIKSKESIHIPKVFFCIMAFVAFTTFTHTFDDDSIKSLVFITLEILTFILYISDLKGDYIRIKKVIYTSAWILSIYGFIQLIGFYLGIPFLYDTTLYGFSANSFLQANNGLVRPYSLYSEPSHLCAILSSSFYLGLLDKKEEYTSDRKTILIFVFSLFTVSSMVYISIAIFLLVYFLFNKKRLTKKARFIFWALIISVILYFLFPDFFRISWKKIMTIFSATSTSTSDLSGFAIISNLRIAIAKMFDGYFIGTGIDSHRLYYYTYIHHFYPTVLMYLNEAEAASMFTRILSEFGIVGFSYYIFFICKKFFMSLRQHNNMLLFMVVLLVVQGIRNGHYNAILFALSFAFCLCIGKRKRKEGEIVNETAKVD